MELWVKWHNIIDMVKKAFKYKSSFVDQNHERSEYSRRMNELGQRKTLSTKTSTDSDFAGSFRSKF